MYHRFRCTEYNNIYAYRILKTTIIIWKMSDRGNNHSFCTYGCAADKEVKAIKVKGKKSI
jgi:hypothetical protein